MVAAASIPPWYLFFSDTAIGFLASKWLEPRFGSNPLRLVQKVENRRSQKREHRAFTVGEVQKLLAVAWRKLRPLRAFGGSIRSRPRRAEDEAGGERFAEETGPVRAFQGYKDAEFFDLQRGDPCFDQL